MLKYKTYLIDYYKPKTKIPEDRILTNYIYNNFDFDIMDTGFKSGNLTFIDDYFTNFLKANNEVFKKIKKWDFNNSFKARLYIVDFMLTIFTRRYLMKCDGKFPRIQHMMSTKHLLVQSDEDTNIKNLICDLVDQRNTISRMLTRSRFLRIKNGAIV